MIYLITAELFGAEVALIAAALWAFDPSAIGFNRVAKEDTFLLFFFLLANVFWLRGQRVAESTDRTPNSLLLANRRCFRRDDRLEVCSPSAGNQHVLLLDVPETFLRLAGAWAPNAFSNSLP